METYDSRHFIFCFSTDFQRPETIPSNLWNRTDFAGTLEKLFTTYINNIDRILNVKEYKNLGSSHIVKQICGLIKNSVGRYLAPSLYSYMYQLERDVMSMGENLVISKKSEEKEWSDDEDELARLCSLR